MPAFIQLTDTHIVPEGELAYGRSDTAQALVAAIETINARVDGLGDVTCVLITGDLTEAGTPEEYARFTALMSELTLPWIAIPGNHDTREGMRSAFAAQDWMPARGPIHWSRDFGPFSVIGLDTLEEGAHYGMLSDEGLAFVDEALGAIGDQMAVIATHHPWMKCGITAMDADNLRNGAALMKRLEAHPGPVRMISGHVHRAQVTQIGKVTCQVAPAPCHAVHLDHRGDAVNSLVLEPGAITLHRWIETGLVSDVLPIGQFPGPWPFGAV